MESSLPTLPAPLLARVASWLSLRDAVAGLLSTTKALRGNDEAAEACMRAFAVRAWRVEGLPPVAAAAPSLPQTQAQTEAHAERRPWTRLVRRKWTTARAWRTGVSLPPVAVSLGAGALAAVSGPAAVAAAAAPTSAVAWCPLQTDEEMDARWDANTSVVGAVSSRVISVLRVNAAAARGGLNAGVSVAASLVDENMPGPTPGGGGVSPFFQLGLSSAGVVAFHTSPRSFVMRRFAWDAHSSTALGAWSVRPPSSQPSPPACMSLDWSSVVRRVALATLDGRVSWVDVERPSPNENGEVEWRSVLLDRLPNEHVLAMGSLGPSRVVVVSSMGNVVAVDARSPELVSVNMSDGKRLTLAAVFGPDIVGVGRDALYRGEVNVGPHSEAAPHNVVTVDHYVANKPGIEGRALVVVGRRGGSGSGSGSGATMALAGDPAQGIHVADAGPTAFPRWTRLYYHIPTRVSRLSASSTTLVVESDADPRTCHVVRFAGS